MDVTLRFVPPDEPGLLALRVYEAANSGGPYEQVDRTLEIGDYPDYIHAFTTPNATSNGDWFAIAWEDETGAVGELSVGVQGGTESLVGEVADRVLQRDRSLDYSVIVQEAEAVIEEYIGDPYTTDVTTVSYRKLLGLVYLTMANCYVLGGFNDESSVQIGLVRMQQGLSANKDVDSLIDLANRYLGISTSRVLQTTSVYQRHCLHEVFGA